MTRRSIYLALLLGSSSAVGCGDDGDDVETDASSSSGSESSTNPSASSEGSSTTGTSTAATTDAPATSGSGSSEGSDSSSSAVDESGSSSSGGEEFDCRSLPDGPFEPMQQFTPFAGSEDLAFDGAGGLAGKNGGNIVVVDSEGAELDTFADAGPAYGLRYAANGDLLVAHFQTGVIASIDSAGVSSNFATGVSGVNGLYPDFEGNVWVTDFSSVLRFDSAGAPTTIVSGSDGSGANGIVYDPVRGVAFFTNYGAGRIAKVEIGDDGSPGAVTALSTVAGALFDGLALDVCGNLYAVDNGAARVYRLSLDENADAVGDATDIVDGSMQNIANAQFGRGDGFEATSLYASGNPGIVYRLDVGVPGAAIPLP